MNKPIDDYRTEITQMYTARAGRRTCEGFLRARGVRTSWEAIKQALREWGVAEHARAQLYDGDPEEYARVKDMVVAAYNRGVALQDIYAMVRVNGEEVNTRRFKAMMRSWGLTLRTPAETKALKDALGIPYVQNRSDTEHERRSETTIERAERQWGELMAGRRFEDVRLVAKNLGTFVPPVEGARELMR